MYQQEVGTRALVGHGIAKRTTGGLTQADLVLGEDGKWKSKKKAGQIPPQLAAFSEARKQILDKRKKKESFEDHTIKKGTKEYDAFMKKAKKLQKKL